MSVSEITQRREERAQIINDMQGLIDQADAEERDLTGEETAKWESMDTRAAELLADIDRRERIEKIKPTSLTMSTSTSDGTPEDEQRSVPMTLREYNASVRGAVPQDDDEYRAAFFKLVTRGPSQMDVTEMRALSRATNAAGAYLVPTSFERQIIDLMRDTGNMRNLATVITTEDGSPLQMATVSAHGTASWVAENAAFNLSDETFGTAAMSAYKAGTAVLVSEELLQDSAIDLDGYLSREVAIRIGVLENTAYVVGDGVGKPTGITTQTTAGKVGATGQTTTVTSDDLIDLMFSVPNPYRRNAAWLMNEGGVKALMKLKDTTGQYIWSPGLTAGAPDTLFGRPVYTDPDMPVMAANAKSILFGEFSYYQIRDVRGIAVQRLNELYAMNGQVGFRAYHRTDGKLLNTAAVKHYANSAT